MNRFEKHFRIIAFLNKCRFSVLISLLFVGICLAGIQSVNKSTSEKRFESLQNALQRSITQCYAVEGTYPPSLDYLKEHYGLTYNEDEFFVDYQSVGSNMRPDVTIITLKGGNHELP